MDAETLQRWVDDTPAHAFLGRIRAGLVDGGVELVVELSPEVANERGGDIAHGGVAAALLDSACTFALIADSGGDWSTVDLRIDFLRPVPVGPVRAIGRVVKAGRRVGRAEGSLLDAAGTECARAVGTFVPTG